ncbi:MAG: MBL fold metallo-hydrolase [Bdellovibrionales bacterium]|nr:MBL fold metallo-hydrolase [Bdellovibrionales bacterium]
MRNNDIELTSDIAVHLDLNTNDMTAWFTVKKIDNSTYSIAEYGHWEKVHSFLLIGKERAALVDTGIGIDDISAVVSGLTDLPITVITTHCHWDHIGGHQYYSEIAVHADDRDWMENGIPLSLQEMRGMLMQEPFSKPPPDSFVIEDWVPFTGKPTIVLKDEDKIDLGERKIKILHTPGHAPGHICILDETNGYLLTGDLVYRGTPLFAFFESTDPLAYYDSVKRVASLKGIRRLLTSHNEATVEPAYLGRVLASFETLKARGALKHGTGIHEFEDVQIHF